MKQQHLSTTHYTTGPISFWFISSQCNFSNLNNVANYYTTQISHETCFGHQIQQKKNKINNNLQPGTPGSLDDPCSACSNILPHLLPISGTYSSLQLIKFRPQSIKTCSLIPTTPAIRYTLFLFSVTQ